MKVICLTGGLASGKSTAAKHLAERGAVVIDADILGHQAYKSGTDAFKSLIQTFGEGILNDERQIDRPTLGSRVFGKPVELKKLTDIVWPEIRRLAETEIASITDRESDALIVLEAAVLFEAGWEDMGKETWVLTVDRETAIQRSMARDNTSRDAAERRLDSQLSNEARAARADRVITNNSNIDSMLAQINIALAECIGAPNTR